MSQPVGVRSRAARYLSAGANRWFIVAAALVGLVHLAFAVVGIVVAPVGFDEAYVVQAPWNLVDGNGYATFDWYQGTTPRLFDTLLSTGPVVLLPISVTFAAFGVGIVQVRCTMLLFAAFLVVVTWLLGRRIGGRWVGLVAATALLTLNLRWDLPQTATWSTVDGLGEFPAVAFIVLSVLLLRRRPSAAGLAIGLAAMCKFVAFLAVPALLVALLVLLWAHPWRARILGVLRFGVLGLAPFAAWEAVKLITLGPTAYFPNLKSYASFVLASGSGVTSNAGPPDVSGRITYLASAWFLPALLALGLVAVMVVLTVVRIRAVPPADEETGVAAGGLWPELIGGLGALALYLLWWIGFSDSFFARHVFPGLLLIPAVLVSFAGGGIVAIVRSGRRPLQVLGVTLAGVGLALGGIQVVQHFVQSFDVDPYTRADQLEAVAAIHEIAPDGVQHVAYWSNPELRLLGGFDSVPFPLGDGPLVLSPQMAAIAPAVYELARERCVEVLYERGGFLVCSVDPLDDDPLDADQID